MSKLNELIAELCPDGIEHCPLWEVTIWDKKFNSVEREKQLKVISYPHLLASDMFALQLDSGNVFLLSTGEQTGWTSEELAGDYLCEGEVVTIPWGKSRAVTDCIKYYKGKFVTADNRIATSRDTNVLLNKYLYYWMMSQGETIDTFYRGAGIQHPSMKSVLDMQIPLPPLPVQSEIVRILDNFTELTAALTAELTARKAQYAYYQDKLLTRSVGTIYTLGECCVSIADGDHQPPPKADSGVPFVTISNFSENGIDFTDTKFVPQEYYDKLDKKRRAQKDDILYSVVGSFGIPVHITEDKPFVFQRHIAILRPNAEMIAPRYLYHVMKSDAFYKKADAAAIGAAQRTISLSALNHMKISVPSLEVQERLVRVLDNFDAICTDLNIGLPAEIEARKKQYEFYRDQLLTFAEIGKTILTDRQTDRQTDRRV